MDIAREGVRGCVTIRQLRTFQIFVTVDKRLFFLHNLSPINFGKVEANRVFWCLQKWLEIWPTDALNFFRVQENTKKLVTEWVIISGPKTASASKSWTYLSYIIFVAITKDCLHHHQSCLSGGKPVQIRAPDCWWGVTSFLSWPIVDVYYLFELKVETLIMFTTRHLCLI